MTNRENNAPRLRQEDHSWLADPALQRLLELLEEDGEEARIVGGAVRNSLLGIDVADLDIATTRLPQSVIDLMGKHEIKCVPTGIDHGTVTVVLDRKGFEVTTLRQDIETNGRHAVVRFGRDWRHDAERRDLTINALYCDRHGQVIDVLGGCLSDLESRTIRFIGEADQRIEEDYLRILRFFRFFAFYGKGRPDAQGLKACARLKDGLDQLAAERVWKEFHRTLEAPDPARALLWMRQVGVLGKVLPESIKWGIDLVPDVVEAQQALGLEDDAMPRLMAMVRPDEARMMALGERLKLSNAQKERMLNWAMADSLQPDWSRKEVEIALYRGNRQAIIDASLMELARLRHRAKSDDKALDPLAKLAPLVEFAICWERPVFPITGKNLLARGEQPGRALGEKLAALESDWLENGFQPTAEMQEILGATGDTA